MGLPPPYMGPYAPVNTAQMALISTALADIFGTAVTVAVPKAEAKGKAKAKAKAKGQGKGQGILPHSDSDDEWATNHPQIYQSWVDEFQALAKAPPYTKGKGKGHRPADVPVPSSSEEEEPRSTRRST